MSGGRRLWRQDQRTPRPRRLSNYGPKRIGRDIGVTVRNRPRCGRANNHHRWRHDHIGSSGGTAIAVSAARPTICSNHSHRPAIKIQGTVDGGAATNTLEYSAFGGRHQKHSEPAFLPAIRFVNF